MRVSRDALGEIERWAEGIRRAPEAGYRCDRGKVSASLSSQCRGHFETSARETRRLCEWGWCCINGRLVETDAGRCAWLSGRF